MLSDVVHGEVMSFGQDRSEATATALLTEDQMLLLKLKWATAHPIRSARDLARFLNPRGSYSNR